MTKNTIKTLINTLLPKDQLYDLELIIAHVIKRDRVFVISHPSHSLTDSDIGRITILYKKRSQGYPLAYITGVKEFFGRDFKVNKHTLIPRPETEILIENTLSFISKNHLLEALIIDIGTGSGIIPITLNIELPKKIKKTILASDISSNALEMAKENAMTHNSSSISFLNSDLLKNGEFLKTIINNNAKNIILTANLPYVNDEIKNNLLKQEESISLIHEPQIALWSSDAGLFHYKQLTQQIVQLNKLSQKNITSFYEISPEQHDIIVDYIQKMTSEPKIKSFKDLSGKNRIIQFTLQKP